MEFYERFLWDGNFDRFNLGIQWRGNVSGVNEGYLVVCKEDIIKTDLQFTIQNMRKQNSYFVCCVADRE